MHLNYIKEYVKLRSDSRHLQCFCIVRVVPQKRLVCRGVWADQSVYAKIFIGKNAQHYALRDKTGVEALQAAGVPTPALLLFSELEARGEYVLVFSAIENSKNAEEELCYLDATSRFSLMQKIVRVVAQHHQAGLIQTDLYFKNFLVQKQVDQEDLIYTLDGDGIRRLSPIFKKRTKMHNLAALFSKIDVLDEGWIPALYTQYCEQIGIACAPKDETNVRHLTQKIRHQVASGYADKKVFRNCTDVSVTQNFWRFEAVASNFKMGDHELAALDSFLADAQRNIKNGNTCTISKAEIANQQVVVKRYNIKNFWHGINRAFRPSRAAKSWANAHRLIISNIATAKPLALIEKRFGFVRRRAYFLSEFIDAPDVMHFFAQSGNSQVKQLDKQTVAHNLAALFYKLYLLKFTHGDCKASNIKIVNAMPVLIDLDSMQAHFGSWLGHWWFERKHVKDLKRFMQNWANDVEMTSLLKQAFVLQYPSRHADKGRSILFRAGIAQTKVK